MNRFKYLAAALLLALGVLATLPETAHAQRRGGRGGRGGWGNYYGGSGYYGGGGYGNYGYGGYGNYPGYNNYNRSYYQPGYTYDSFYPPDTYNVAPAADPNSATLQIRVPDPNAAVSVDGTRLQQSGTTRVFSTPPLEPGYTYGYTVRAGNQERQVRFQAGDRVTVDFTQSATQSHSQGTQPNTQSLTPPSIDPGTPAPRPATQPKTKTPRPLLPEPIP